MRKEGEAGVDHGAAVLDFGSSKVICAYGTGAPGRAVQIRGANAVYYRDFAIGRDSASPQSWQAVSYTHLDVYKRQTPTRWRPAAWCSRNFIPKTPRS